MSNFVNQFRSFFQNRLDRQLLFRAKANEKIMRSQYKDAMVQLEKMNTEKTNEYASLKETFYKKYVTDVVEEFQNNKSVTEKEVQTFQAKTIPVFEYHLENAWAPIARQYEANMSLFKQIKTDYENLCHTIDATSERLGIVNPLDEGKTLKK